MSAVSMGSPPTPRLAITAVMRLVGAALPDSEAVEPGAPLEHTTPDTRPTRLISAAIIEGHELRALRVYGEPLVGVAAFLDGTQKSEIVTHRDGVPIVLGTVAAAVRD